MVVPAPHRGLVRLRRRVEDPGGAWEVSPPFAASLGSVDAVSLCVGNRGSPESLEILARTGGALRHLSLPATVEIGAEDDSTRAELGIDDAAGVPAIVQGAFGNRGNLEVVTPTLGGGLAHLWRDNDHRDGPWERTADFGEGPFESVALIHGDLHDHLELIARVGPRLVHWWRTNADSSRWREAEMRRAEGEGQCPPVTGVPGFLHSRRSG
jgi:hypothetical protein